MLCDVWRPANGDISGLAFVYFHGGVWYMWDKDFGARPFFRHLVAQGHNYDKNMRDAGRLDILLSGQPQDAPHMYELASPITHVHPGCPPTLLIQGNRDLVTSVDATCALYTKLVKSGVPAINIVLPRTDHGFDLFLPQINPAAQSALYDLDRFLALLLNKE